MSDACIDNILSAAFLNHRENLPEVPSPEHHNTPKRPVTVKDVLQSVVHCFHAIPVLHGNLIPNDCNSLLEKLCFEAILRYIAMGSVIHIQWNVEAGV